MRSQTTPVQPSRFFVLTFVLSWFIWIPLVLSHFNIRPFLLLENASPIIRLLGVLMPAAAALLLSIRSGGKEAVGALLHRLKIWRVGWKWWFAAVIIPPLLLVVIGLAFNAAGSGAPIKPLPGGGIAVFVINIFFLLLATLGEEIGWRGMALPALQEHNPPVKASIILGLLWGVWHIPFWLLLDTFDQFGWVYLLMNLMMVIPFSMYITWFFNNSRSSLLLPVMFHLSFNIVNTSLFPVTLHIGAFGVFIAALWVISFLIVRHMDMNKSPDPQSAEELEPVIQAK